MDYEDILDEEQIKSQELWDALSWWEQRRLKFNLIVGAFGCLTIAIFYSTSLRLPPPIAFFVLALFYGVFSNIAYLLSWVLEFILRYYLNIKFSIFTRQVIFWLGTILALSPPFFILVQIIF